MGENPPDQTPGTSGTQEQKPNFIREEARAPWFEKFESAFATQKVAEVTNNVSVMKVPACYRVPSEQYTPKKWIFGLHNRDGALSSESEDLKMALAAACQVEPWHEFCASVVHNPGLAFNEYGLSDGNPKFSKKEVQYLLTLDALTIFFVFAYYAPRVTLVDEMQKGLKLIRKRISWGYAYVPIDLFMLENQITLALVKDVIRICYQKWEKGGFSSAFQNIVKANVFQMCGYIFELTEHHRTKIEMTYPDGDGAFENSPHMVACIYKVLCGDNWGKTSGGASITIQSATALKKAGIRIKGKKGVLDKVSFKVCFHKGCLFLPCRKGCLSLPIVKLYDPTESYFRNLAMYEFMQNYNSSVLPFGEYLQLMTSLIKEVGDVKHLINCGVIQNNLGTDKNAFQMWDSLQSQLFLPIYSTAHADMVSKINKQCKSSLNVITTEFYQLFCSRPWYVIGVITASLVTVGTCIQAYTAVIGSHKMEPHYPP